MSNETAHFVIYHPVRRVIWKGPFKTLDAAERELKAQTLLFSGKHEWVIEQHFHRSSKLEEENSGAWDVYVE